MYRIAEAFVRWIAPILSFTADEMWQHLPLPGASARQRAVHHLVRRPGAAAGRCAAVGRGLRPPAGAARAGQQDRWSRCAPPATIGAALEAEIELRCGVADQNWLAPFADELRFLLISGDVLGAGRGDRQAQRQRCVRAGATRDHRRPSACAAGTTAPTSAAIADASASCAAAASTTSTAQGEERQWF